MKMKKLAQRLGMAGADLSTRKTLKAGLRILGIKPENIDKMYVDMKNDMNMETFMRTPPADRVVFIPQCLRKAKSCSAKVTDDGYACADCGAKCGAWKIKKICAKAGCKSFILPGSSMARKLVRAHKPKAVMGIACMKELTVGIEEMPVTSIGIELMKDGCINTEVDVEKIEAALRVKNGKA